MAAPPPRGYDPRLSGAACEACPLACKGEPPLPVSIRQVGGGRPTFTVVIDAPDAAEKYSGNLGDGRPLAKVLEHLDGESFVIVPRIACHPPPNKRIDKHLKAAARACHTRVLNDLEKTPSRRLYLGTLAPHGVLPSAQHSAHVEVLVSQGILRNGSMVLSHPRIAFFHAPENRDNYVEALRRFVRNKPPKWPWEDICIEPSEQALEWLRGMGDVIAYDSETFGKDPLT